MDGKHLVRLAAHLFLMMCDVRVDFARARTRLFLNLPHLTFRIQMKSGAIFASASLSEVALGPTALHGAGNPMMGLK